MKLVFDIETDGIDATKVWCIVAQDVETKKIYKWKPDDIDSGISFLMNAEALIGHNIIGYDNPVINKLYPWFRCPSNVVDTLLISRLLHPNLMEIDKKKKWKYMPLQLYGRHSLEAYGHRLGEYKGQFGKTTDWKEWSPEMEAYMIQDVNVTNKLCTHFAARLNG